ncbi:MAG: glycosyltransferase family 9 protein [Ignavibacteria bacterium]|nr:glycosyltransferase family 9 protein [Ignavibacteria bacterium]
MKIAGVDLKTDCIHFKGDIPCKPHKLHGVHCSDCSYYEKRAGRILIIKLGAAGDVIRTSVLLSPLQERYPNHEIWWLTHTPEVVSTQVHKRLKFNAENALTVQGVEFDVAINLDKDTFACALMQTVNARNKFGFTLQDGLPAPVNELAEKKFLTGVFDDINQSNTVSYPQEIIELCGFEYKNQPYVMDAPGAPPITLANDGKLVVGLNTGCGDRWLAREWPLDYWKGLIQKLHENGYRVLLLGGPAEHERNVDLEKNTSAEYYGTFPLKDFLAVVNLCDVVVTAVTMAMHIAIGLKKRLVLFNNIFNKHEFELYGYGTILEPDVQCTCFFQHACTNPNYSCMEHLSVDAVFEAVVKD